MTSRNGEFEMSEKIEYRQLSSACVTPTRNIVVSTCSRGGFTLAQQLITEENGTSTKVFLKGAFHIDGLDGLVALRDALDEAIGMAIKIEEEDSIDWDAIEEAKER